MSSFQCFIFLKGEYGRIRNGKYQLLKTDRSRYIVIALKSWKGLELVSSLQNWSKILLEMFVKRCTCIWPNFILILLRFPKNKQKRNFHYAAMFMMTSKVLKLVDWKIKNKNLHICRTKHYFFFNWKNSVITHQGLLYGKK